MWGRMANKEPSSHSQFCLSLSISMGESSDRMWSTGEGDGKPLQYSCLENPMNSMKRQKDRTLKDELPRSMPNMLLEISGKITPERMKFSSVQSLSHVLLFATPWIAARQASLSITNSRSSFKLMSIKSVMPSSYLILCHPFLLLPPILPSIGVFFSESILCMRWPKYWSFNFSIIPSRKISISALLTTPKPLCGSQ